MGVLGGFSVFLPGPERRGAVVADFTQVLSWPASGQGQTVADECGPFAFVVGATLGHDH